MNQRLMSRTVFYLSVVYVLFLSCSGTTRKDTMSGDPSTQDSRWESKAEKMVEAQIVARGVRDPGVIRVMKNTPRHLFVPEQMRGQAYGDHPLPIGSGQTISQPYIVALMTATLELSGTERVLEVGTGSGYQAAILAQLADSCYSMEVVRELADQARERLNPRLAGPRASLGLI